MGKTTKISFVAVVGLILALSVPGLSGGQIQNSHMARPGSINYVEDQASHATHGREAGNRVAEDFRILLGFPEFSPRSVAAHI